MYYAKEFIIASLNFIAFFLIPFFAEVFSASPSEARALQISQDSGTGSIYVPLSKNTILQQLAQNQQINPNQDNSDTQTCLPKKKGTNPNGQKVKVKTIRVTGSTVFGDEDNTLTLEEFIEEINQGRTDISKGESSKEDSREDPIKILEELIEEIKGRSVTSEELKIITDAITQLYLNQGFLNSRAIEDSSRPGVVVIIEGELEEINILGISRLNYGYICSRVQLGAGKPLNVNKLEDQLRLLRANPLFDNVEASLRAGSGVGKSILTLRVTEAFPFEANLGIDNYSPPSVGGERLNLNLLHRNLTGFGDEFSVSYRPRIETIDGTYRLDFGYQVPLNPKNGTIRVNAFIDRNEVIEGDFEDLDIRGEAEQYEIIYRQPFIRNPRQELALSLGFVYRDGQTFLFQNGFPFGVGPDQDGVSRTSVFELGQEYTLRSVSGAWAFRSQLRFGTDLFDATENSSPDPDGQFFSWLAQIQRVQVLNDDNFLIIQGELQLTPDSLLPSEQFVVGGGQSVRGYRQNVRSGDNGFRFSMEDRITLVRNEGGEPVFIMAPFFDMGSVWNNSDNPNNIPDQRFVAALGLGLLWQPIEGLNLRLDYAPPLIDLDDRGDDVQDNGFNFSVNYQF